MEIAGNSLEGTVVTITERDSILIGVAIRYYADRNMNELEIQHCDELIDVLESI